MCAFLLMVWFELEVRCQLSCIGLLVRGGLLGLFGVQTKHPPRLQDIWFVSGGSSG